MKKSLKSEKNLSITGDKLTEEQIQNDIDVIRLKNQVLEVQNMINKKETELTLSEWSFVKSKEGNSEFESEFSFSQPISRETKEKITLKILNEIFKKTKCLYFFKYVIILKK